jgi:ferredoxin
MGFRDRLKERIKGVIGSGAAPASPAAPAKVVSSGPISAPTPPAAVEPQPVAPAPAAVEPQPVAPAPAAAEPAIVAAEPIPAAVPIVAAEPAAAAPPTALRFVADSADAPKRNVHIAQARDASGVGYAIHFHNEKEGFNLQLTAEPGEYLLDAVERLGAVLPYSCRNGGCLSCTAKLVSGTYEMGEQYTLEEEQIERGFFLLCCSHATSDMEILTHMQDDVG